LRRFARQGAEEELDLDDTIRSTARQGGLLDIRMVPERHNAIKVLLFLDIGGSMDDHVRLCEELFSAARSEFKHLEYFYFHNCVYESVWRDNRRRHAARTPTMEVLRTYGRDYKLIFVGDATMSPYEIIYPGGSVEHWNEEPGSLWMQRLLDTYGSAVWLNPEPEQRWDYTPSTGLLRDLMERRMFPLTIGGLERGMKELM
ncbi:MAG: VWA domain-containing protein, partial [Chromatiales bacterium]|nr:VWA domain-containing protein [Chromatiales bacterium]